MIGVKALIAELKPKFDRIGKATKKAKKNIADRGEKASKELLALEVDLVLAEWDKKIKRGEDIQKQLCIKELKENSKAVLEERDLYYNRDNYSHERSNCELVNRTTYLEKFLYSPKYDIVGYADKIVVERNTITIIDNKVWDRVIRSSSYKTDNGFQVVGEKMLEPLQHLDNCNYNDAALQLSLYMYLAWESNKHLKIGKLYIRHIKLNDSGKKVSDKLIQVPYMKEEVKKILKYKKLNDEG